MQRIVHPVKATLSDSTPVVVEALPPHVEAAREFLAVHNAAYMARYIGMSCRLAESRPGTIEPGDAADFYNRDHTWHTSLI